MIDEDYLLADAGSVAKSVPETTINKKNLKKIIIGVLFLLLIIGIIITVIILYSKGGSKQNFTLKGEINCEYNIETTLSETNILGKDFLKKN